MTKPVHTTDEKLPFPTRPLEVRGRTVEEYIIPEEKKAEILELLYTFHPIPGLDDELFDLHESKKFIVRDFRVTWENGQNLLTSPYYPESGGTFVDWMPLDFLKK